MRETAGEVYVIGNVLEASEISLKENHIDIYKSLSAPATVTQIEELRIKCFSGTALPSDLVDLYKWHNGQSGSGPFNPKDNRTFLPIADVIDSWTFLNDPMEDILEPISKSWIPLLHNGAGDYLMLETQGNNEGKILAYWHDDIARSIEWNSLCEWVDNLLCVVQS